MTKQLTVAVLILASLFVASCKKETCAKCELKEYCANCVENGSTLARVCGSEEELITFGIDCGQWGGVISGETNTVNDTREMCDEQSSAVNDFMDEKVADGYKCKYID